jgi:hypothetical protein
MKRNSFEKMRKKKMSSLDNFLEMEVWQVGIKGNSNPEIEGRGKV